MNKDKTPPAKSFQIRCPKLGHQIYFSYCRQENWGDPCPKTLDCWHCYFDVVGWLQSEMSPQEWENAFVKPAKSKIVSLVELIDKAKEVKK